MPPVEMMEPAQLRERRAELLRDSGMTEDQLRERAEQYLLPAELIAVVDELDEINFLLGG